MEKYVLVPHAKYEQMLKSNNKQTAADNPIISSLVPPPPGMPADDSLASQGINISNKEAQEIQEKLIDIGYNQNNNLSDNDTGDNITQQSASENPTNTQILTTTTFGRFA